MAPGGGGMPCVPGAMACMPGGMGPPGPPPGPPIMGGGGMVRVIATGICTAGCGIGTGCDIGTGTGWPTGIAGEGTKGAA